MVMVMVNGAAGVERAVERAVEVRLGSAIRILQFEI